VQIQADFFSTVSSTQGGSASKLTTHLFIHTYLKKEIKLIFFFIIFFFILFVLGHPNRGEGTGTDFVADLALSEEEVTQKFEKYYVIPSPSQWPILTGLIQRLYPSYKYIDMGCHRKPSLAFSRKP